MRIVSLVPSATEIVFALGLGDELVGVSEDCDFPPDVRHVPVVSRRTQDLTSSTSGEIHAAIETAMHNHEPLYVLDDAVLAAVEPDLILTQELCRVCAVGYREVNEVARRLDGDVAVVSLEPTSIEGILNSIQTVGAMTEAEDSAVDVVEGLRERLQAVSEIVVGGGTTALRRRAWRPSSGSIRRSPSGTGCPSRCASRAAGSCWATRAASPSRRPGRRSPRWIRRSSS